MGWKMQQDGQDRDNTQTNGPTTSLPDRFLEETAQRIRELAEKTAQNILEIGRRLTAVKQRLGHGEWESWVRRELGWHPSTAWRLMRVGRLASTQDVDIAEMWGNRRRRLAANEQRNEGVQPLPAALPTRHEAPALTALAAEGLAIQKLPSSSLSSLPLKEAIERASAIWRVGKTSVPGPVAILSTGANGSRSLHLVGSSMHVELAVAESEVSSPCSHEEYLIAIKRASPKGGPPADGSQDEAESSFKHGENEASAGFSVSFAALEPSLRLLTACTAKPNTCSPLAGILVRIQNGKVAFIASDGCKLWLSSFSAETEREGDFIVPPQAFAPFKRLREVLHAQFSPHQACLALGSAAVHTLLIRGPYPFSGQFPSPDSEDTLVTVEGRALAQALTALTKSGTKGRMVWLRCAKDVLTLAVEESSSKPEESIPAVVRGEAHLLLDLRALLELARLLPTLEMCIKPRPAPVVVQSKHGMGLLMPLAFSNGEARLSAPIGSVAGLE